MYRWSLVRMVRRPVLAVLFIEQVYPERKWTWAEKEQLTTITERPPHCSTPSEN